MTFDRNKILAEGGTYHDDSNPLVECFEFTPKVSHVTVESLAPTMANIAGLKEDATPVKRMVIEGVFQRADTQNANKRVYPRGLWEKVLAEDAPAIQTLRSRAMIGHLEHPESGTTDLNKGALLITDLELREDGVVWGKAIVYNTPEGLRLQEYIATGTRIGISSRGTGTVDSKGVVQEDYALGTFDAVYNPSTPGAHPTAPGKKVATEAVATAPAGLPKPTLPESTDPRSKPMTVAKRIQEAEALVARLVNFDRLTMDEAAVAVRDAEILEARVKIAKDVTEAGAPDLVAKFTAALDAARAKLTESIPLPRGATSQGTDSATLARLALNLAASMQAAAAADVTKMDSPLFHKLLVYGTRLGGIKESAAPAGDAPATDDPLALLGEARETITKMAEDQETSAAIITGLREQVEGLQAANDDAGAALATAVAVIADLSSVDHAGKVREAVEKALSEHPTLAPFRDTLTSLRTPAAVAAKTEGILKSLADTARNAATSTLEARLAKVSGKPIVESTALPAKGSKSASEPDAAEPVVEDAQPKPTGKRTGAALLSPTVMSRVMESVGAIATKA